MQNTTGCKINVAPASSPDIEREIGLVGSRASIEQAKRAIMDKVHTVVSSIISILPAPTLIRMTGREESPGRWRAS